MRPPPPLPDLRPPSSAPSWPSALHRRHELLLCRPELRLRRPELRPPSSAPPRPPALHCRHERRLRRPHRRPRRPDPTTSAPSRSPATILRPSLAFCAPPPARAPPAPPRAPATILRPSPTSCAPLSARAPPAPPRAPPATNSAKSPATAAAPPLQAAPKMAKAIWDAEATTIFCKICVIEKESGNRPTKFLSPTGYRNLAVAFYEKTGRHYSKMQFKNKWDNRKSLYTNWLIFKNKATCLGWNDEANTVVADDDWWKKIGDENKDLLQFRKHGPENLDDMSRMFENVHVTGESSIMPGTAIGSVLQEGAEVHNVEDDDEEENEVQSTPSGPAKRGAGQIDGNPKKKNPVQRDFKRMVDHLISEDQSVNSSKVSIATEIERIMAEVVACGADEGSDEYFMATKLFAKLENRCFFYTMKTSEGRKNWLRRMYQERKRH